MANGICVNQGERFTVKISVGVRDDRSRRMLIDAIDFEAVVEPAARKYTSNEALFIRCESLALEQYSKKLWADIENNDAVAAKLENRDWSIQTKTKKVCPYREPVVAP